MTRRNQGALIALGIAVLCGVVILGWRVGNNDAAKVGAPEIGGSTATTISVGTCATERGILGGTTCNPSRDQVAKIAEIPIASSVTNFTATYEGFQEWRLRASFTVPLDQASVYTSLPNYPGATVDGPGTNGTGGHPSEYRNLKLATVDGLLQVSISVFTT
jgi:hypothetical protein